MNFQDPFKIYIAESNIEAQLIVQMLETNGIPAYADEDQSGVSLSAFGSLPQFHQPNVWVDKADGSKAGELIVEFEERKESRREQGLKNADSHVEAVCEECGGTTLFPANLKGKVEQCEHCDSYVDVGELDWEDEGWRTSEE